MWGFFWDTFGFIADNVSRPLKIFLTALILVIVFFFFGFGAVFYFLGGIFTVAFLFLIIANVVVRIKRARKKSREAPIPELTPADQADIAEFQEAMNKQPAANPITLPAQKATPSTDLPETPAAGQ
ncbi:MAG: hypothetical protein Q8P33_01530 [bacterium]|nr:hypothetical protein [bacterium]